MNKIIFIITLITFGICAAERKPHYNFHFVHYNDESIANFLLTLDIYKMSVPEHLNMHRMGEKTASLIYKIMDTHPSYEIVMRSKEFVNKPGVKAHIALIEELKSKHDYEKAFRKPIDSMDKDDLDTIWSLWFGSKDRKYVDKIVKLSHKEPSDTFTNAHNEGILAARWSLESNFDRINWAIKGLVDTKDLRPYRDRARILYSKRVIDLK